MSFWKSPGPPNKRVAASAATARAAALRGASHAVVGNWIEALESRQLLSSAHSMQDAAAIAAPVMHAQTVHTPPATVVTNKLEYVPGQIAAITGTGFGANEQVRVQVLHIDGTPNTAPEHKPFTVQADKNGTFHASYHVGADDLNTTLQVTAVGLRTNRKATEIFKDAATATTTTLASSANPSVFGQPVTLTATVTSGSTGTVTFLDGTTTLGTGTLSSSKATFATSALAVSAHSITAKYGGDSTHAASTSAVLTQTVQKAATTVALTSSTGLTPAPIVTPSHIVVVVEEDRGANAIGDTANMPYFNQIAASGLVYSNSHGLNTTSQEGQMTYLGLYSGSTQGVTDNGNHGIFTAPTLAQSLANKGLSFSGYAEALPSAGDTTDNYAADPNNPAYDDLYVRAYNPMAQFSNVGTGLTNASVNKTFASFPTNAAGYASLPTVSFVIPDTLHNTHGSNDTDPYATDPSAYNLLRQDADTWLQQNLDGYLQWAKQNNSLLIVTDDEGDRAHVFANGFATIVNGAPGLFVPGVDTTNVTAYNILRTIEDMYALPQLGSSATAADLDVNAQGKLGVPSAGGGSVVGQGVTFTAKVSPVSPGAGTPTGTVQFTVDGTNLGSAVTLNNGSATSPSVSSLTLGSHNVSAVYSSSGNFAASTAPTLVQSVSQASTTTSVVSSAIASVWSQSVTFTATVSAVAPGGGIPTGTVTFLDGGATLGTGTLNGSGQATFTTSTLAVASHSITAVYGSTTNDAGSTSAALTQSVSKNSTATALSSSLNPASAGQSITFTSIVTPAAPGTATPAGSVTFFDGAAMLGTNVLDGSGKATFTTANLSASSHSITAVYAGNGNFVTSTSAGLNQTVTSPSAASSTALASSANPSVFGQPVTLTATVSPVASSPNTPTGTIQFVVDGSNFGSPVPLINGSASATPLTALTPASHTISALYSGDANFGPSNATGFNQVVAQSSTSTSLVTSSPAAVFGQSATLTATVAIIDSGAGTPGGSVTFSDGATVLGTVPLTAAGQAALTTSSLAVASHNIQATYSGDADFTTSASGILAQSVAQAATTTALSSSANPSVWGQGITFTATVSAVAPGTGTPAGSVTFLDGATTLGTASLNGLGQATFSSSAFPVAAHSITAVYADTANFTGSSSATLAQTVSQDASATALTSSANPSITGQSITFTAIVTAAAPGAGTPTGTVTFLDGTTTLGSGMLDNTGQATFTTADLSVNSHSITAAYAGDGNFAASTSAPLNQVVTLTPSTTAIDSSVNPSVFGQGVTLTATVSPAASSTDTPTGTIQFTVDGSTVGSPVAIVNGTASSTTLSNLSVASHTVSAIYSGDANFNPSSALGFSQVIGKSSTNTALSSSNATPVFGQSVTFTATVAISDAGAGTPTGSVVFRDGATTLGTVSLGAGGQAAYTTSALTVTSHNITATYSGDGNFSGSAAPTFAQNVAQAATSTTVSSSAGTSVWGQGVTFTASVAVSAPGAGAASGTVTFLDGTTTLGTGTVNGSGQATFATSSLAVAAHSITAVYGGSASFSGSTSNAVSQMVNTDATTVALASSSNPSALGQSVTFTATVSAAAPGAGTPSGTVTFFDGATSLGSGTLNSSRQATLTTSALTAASHSITAGYAGDSHFTGSTSSALVQQVTQSAPANDTFANATTITGSSATLTGTNIGATKQTGEPAHAGNAGGKSVWWTWKAPSAGVVAIDTSGSTFDTLLAVYTGTTVSALTAVPNGSNDNDPAGGVVTSKVSFAVTSGTTYKIAVDGFNGASGNITLHLNLSVIPAAPTAVAATQGAFTNKVHITWTAPAGATAYEVWRNTTNSSTSATKISATDVSGATAYDDTTAVAGTAYWYFIKAKNVAGTSGFSGSAEGFLEPINDNFANATVITGITATVTGTNFGASKETGEPNHPVNAGGKSVWWTWTATKSGTVTIDTHGSNFDTLLAVYTGSTVSTLTLVAANDDDPAGGTTTSKVSFAVTAGTTYRICVDGYGAVTGNITLNLNLV